LSTHSFTRSSDSATSVQNVHCSEYCGTTYPVHCALKLFTIPRSSFGDPVPHWKLITGSSSLGPATLSSVSRKNVPVRPLPDAARTETLKSPLCVVRTATPHLPRLVSGDEPRYRSAFSWTSVPGPVTRTIRLSTPSVRTLFQASRAWMVKFAVKPAVPTLSGVPPTLQVAAQMTPGSTYTL